MRQASQPVGFFRFRGTCPSAYAPRVDELPLSTPAVSCIHKAIERVPHCIEKSHRRYLATVISAYFGSKPSAIVY
jgi:hypothetical protein